MWSMQTETIFESSGGGITLNGGEVMVQWKFALAILKECKKNGINTCVETTMFCDQEHLDAIYPYVDLMITDMKSMDTQVHKKYCGAGNEKILVNIKTYSRNGDSLSDPYSSDPGCK